ncbi:hypothetical protein [Staphylococcus aureus]|uniref:hypothetical protein n=1 Tax=Staphylococcus aureus TaxID=1280 RepID=UPI00321C1E2A
MAKLTKIETKLHLEAVELLTQDHLSEDEKDFVLAHWQESANHVNGLAGAFFTPLDLAYDFALDVGNGRVIDLCAGIGTLALAKWRRQAYDRSNGAAPVDIVCVEINPAYVAIGQKIVPEATWICASIFDLPDLGHFDYAMANPPFGDLTTDGAAPRYTGAGFEYKVIDIAAELADFGTFIIPQGSCPFTYSGKSDYREVETAKYGRFQDQTGITLEPGIGVDTSYYCNQWHGVSPVIEIVTADFTERTRTTASASEGAGTLEAGTQGVLELEFAA